MKKLTLLTFTFLLMISGQAMAQSTGGGGGVGPDLDLRTLNYTKGDHIIFNLDEVRGINLDDSTLDNYDLKFGNFSEDQIKVFGDLIILPKEIRAKVDLVNGDEIDLKGLPIKTVKEKDLVFNENQIEAALRASSRP